MRLQPGAKHGECRVSQLLFRWLPDTSNGGETYSPSGDHAACFFLLDAVVLGGVSEKGKRGMETGKVGSGQLVAILRSIQRGLPSVPMAEIH